LYKNINDMGYRIFVINPGSTSTKLAYFEDENKLYEANVFHDAPELAKFGSAYDQLGFRKQMILDFLDENGIDLHGVDAIVGRGGSTATIRSGVYEINDKLLEDTRNRVTGVDHPANLGAPLAYELAAEYGGIALMVDGPKVDEFCDEARITGIDGLYRVSSLHVLNLKGTARLWCREHGMRYEDARLIVCHIDGGMSVSAHDHGRMIDGTNNAWGEGPFTPTRTGALPAYLAAEYFRDKDPQDLMDACTRSGGFVSHFGTSDSDRVHDMAAAGDRKAVLVWNAMIYNICKSIGSMAAVLSGDVDAVICGGGLLRFGDIRRGIEERCGFIAPVYFYPGEVEHEAMAAGALRLLRGEEEPKTYTGEPVWNGSI
jgi:butyrate kinase